MKEKIVTEFLHDVVRKQNLDIHMRNNDNDWDGYFHPEQDPWSDINLTQLGEDWLAANGHQAAQELIDRYRVTDSGELGGGPF
jgi:hypothetical protein